MKRSYLFGGVFLDFKGKAELSGGAFLLSAAAAWLMCAIAALAAASLIANAAAMGEQGLGWLSSAISFLCAAFAGAAAARKKRSKNLATALLTSTALVILLLTVGFLIKGQEMSPSSILSLVSFTYAGVLFGLYILWHPGRENRKRRIRIMN